VEAGSGLEEWQMGGRVCREVRGGSWSLQGGGSRCWWSGG
jgi:hypothetical protein